MTVPPEHFINAMRQLAAGVSLITTSDGITRRGLTATAVCSVSAQPPHLLVCVNRSADAYALLRQTGVFAVNLLSIEQRALADRFAGRDGTAGEARFAVGRWATLVTGAPVLDDSLASFDCRTAHHVEAGTHGILVGAVEAVTLGSGATPMLYHDGDYGLVSRLGD